jgi:hypothetical protein
MVTALVTSTGWPGHAPAALGRLAGRLHGAVVPVRPGRTPGGGGKVGKFFGATAGGSVPTRTPVAFPQLGKFLRRTGRLGASAR